MATQSDLRCINTIPQVKAFVNFALALFDEHLKIAKSAAPSASKEEARSNRGIEHGFPLAAACAPHLCTRPAQNALPPPRVTQVATTLKAQQSYCTAQLENIKTRRVLVRAMITCSCCLEKHTPPTYPCARIHARDGQWWSLRRELSVLVPLPTRAGELLRRGVHGWVHGGCHV